MNKALDELAKVQMDLIKAETEVFKAQISNPQFKATGEQNGGQ